MAERSLDVVIVSYNTRELLIQCLASVYAADWSATRGSLAVWVVDNGSSDGSLDAVRVRFRDCRVIEPGQNLGFSKANNLALANHGGGYVLLLNPDTVVGTDALEKMADYLDVSPEVGMVSCKLVMGNGALDLACRRSFPSMWDGFCRASGLSQRFPSSKWFAQYNMTYLDPDETHEVDAVNGAFMFCRPDAIAQVGLLDERFFMYGEDLDWCYRFKEKKWKVVYHPAATTVHLKGQSSGPKSAAMIDEFFRSNELFARKHYFPRRGPLWQVIFTVANQAWWQYTLIRNSFRKAKRVRP